MNVFNKNGFSRNARSSAYKADTLQGRMNSAGDARQAMLARFRARPDTNDPALVARREAQQAVAEAREIRNAEKKVLRDAELARQATEAAEREAAAAAEAAAQEERAAALKIEQKAARDARYAARKARQAR